MTYVYVAGYARSGSTFLDRVLGSHDGVFSAGELTHLFNYAKAGRPCRCGRAIGDCDVWSRVLADVSMDLGQAHQLTRRCEHGVHGFRSTRQEVQDYRSLWSGVFESLRHVVGDRVIVDASKTTTFTVRRPWLIKPCFESDFKLLHLTRDPRASIWSVRKGGNAIAASRRHKSLSTWRTTGSWVVSNALAEWASRDTPSVSVRYEDLVEDPATALGRLGALVDLDFTPVAQRLKGGGHLSAGHGISGNRMRLSADAALKPDTDWIVSAPREVLVAGASTVLLSRRYGYNTIKVPAARAERSSDQ